MLIALLQKVNNFIIINIKGLMKKISLCLSIIFFAVSLSFSQTVREKEKETVLENNIRAKVQYDYKYTNDKPAKTGKLSSKTQFDKNGNVVLKNYYGPKNEIISWEKYEYDSKGNRTLFERSSSTGQYKKESLYDDEDRIVLESGYDGTEPFKTTYKYDNKGRLTEIIYSFSNQVDEKRVYEYEDRKATVKVLAGGKNLLSLIYLTFDDKGNVVKEVIKTVDGKVLETKTYTYSKTSQVLTEEKEKEGNIIYRIFYDYDSNDNLVKVTEESKTKGKFVKKEFTYNSNSKLTEYKWRRKAADDYNIKTYKLDNKGICIEEHTFYPSTKFKSLSKYKYEYY